MMESKFSLKWKLILWLSFIGFTTSILIHFILLMLGSSSISHTMRQYPILHWQQNTITLPLKEKSGNQKEFSQYLQSLVDTRSYQVFHQDKPFTQISVKAISFIDLNSELVFKTRSAPLATGDIGSQIAIQSRDDLSDALTGHHNSGIESLGGNDYLVIKSVIDTNDKIIGATISWQSWEYKSDQKPFFYISIYEGFKLSLFNTFASFFLIIPSTFILGWLVARIINKRYLHLYKTIEDWGKGDLEKRIKTIGSDEISTSFQRLNQMAEKLNQHQKKLKQLVSIEERQHLAAELHDTVKQQLFASNLQLSTTTHQIDKDPQAAKLSLQKAIEQNRTAFKQVNDLIFTLSPIQIGCNLNNSLLKAFEDWQKNNSIKLSTDINIDTEGTKLTSQIELTEIQQQTVFRSIMEALQNCNKHSNASEVLVRLSQSDSGINWSVEDNGSTNKKTKLGQGLSLMQKRIESLEGKLLIENSNGFKLSASLPILQIPSLPENKSR